MRRTDAKNKIIKIETSFNAFPFKVFAKVTTTRDYTVFNICGCGVWFIRESIKERG